MSKPRLIDTIHLVDGRSGTKFDVSVWLNHDSLAKYLSGRSSNRLFAKAKSKSKATGTRLGRGLILEVGVTD